MTLDGRLVGINIAIIAPAGGNVGIGFAEPIAMASGVMKQLIEHGEVRRGRMGIAIQNLTPDLADALGSHESAGAVVGSVEDGSPAAEAGLQAGDVILVSGAADLRNRVGLAPAGSKVVVEYLRDGTRKVVTLQIEPQRSEPKTAALPDRLMGAQFQDAAGNVVVARVEKNSAAARAGLRAAKNSAAARAGLRAGDVIVAINRRPVTTAAALTEALRESTGKIALDLFRGGAKLFLVIR